MRLVLAKRAVDFLHEADDIEAPTRCPHGDCPSRRERLQSTGGIILIDRSGNIGYARNMSHMPVCWVLSGDEIGIDSLMMKMTGRRCDSAWAVRY